MIEINVQKVKNLKQKVSILFILCENPQTAFLNKSLM